MPTTTSNAAHGNNFQSFINDKLLQLKIDGYLTHVIKEFRIGEPNYTNTAQYYAPFLIQFNDRTRWILFSTTSMRTDRIKGQQWDADRLKQVDATISKALLIYPDEVEEDIRSEFIRQKGKYATKCEFSRIDDILPFGELINHIKAFDNEILQSSIGKSIAENDVPISVIGTTTNIKQPVTSSYATAQGQAWDLGGRNFERFIANTLSNATHLSNWKRNISSADLPYQAFCKILNSLDLPKKEVVKINATSDKDYIGLLPSGGSPKTDVIATISFSYGTDKIFTLSCKRSTKSFVSAHQYSADSFADVLDRNNDKLRALLQTFQIYGNKTDFPEADAYALEAILKTRLHALCRWVVGGYGGDGNQKQLADYVVTYRVDKGTIAIHSTDDYIKKILKSSSGFFGTPFQWTFASGQRGKSIQLKMPVL